MPRGNEYFRNETESGPRREESDQPTLPRRELLKTGVAAGLGLAVIGKSGVGSVRASHRTDKSLLEIVATDEGKIEYEVIVLGSAEKTTVSEKIKSEPDGNDEINRLSSTAVSIRGVTGDAGYGDAYLIDGDIDRFRRISGGVDIEIRLDGERVMPYEFTDDPYDDPSSLLEIVATEDGEIRYEVVVDGIAEKTRVSEKIKSEPGGNDEIDRIDSDTVVIKGYTGNAGYGDAYRIGGEIVDFRRVDGDADVDVRLDGETVPLSRFSAGRDDQSSLLEIVATEEGEISYEAVVEGTATKTTVSEKIKSKPDGNDEIRRVDSDTVVIEGYTGNTGYGDAYLIDGDIVDFRRVDGDADVTIRLDGKPLAADRL